MSKESDIAAMIAAALDARTITPEAARVIMSGEFRRYASTRGMVAELLERHKYRAGRPSSLDDQAKALNRLRDLRRQPANVDSMVATLAAEFPMLDNFASILHKPSGKIIKRANELKSVKTFDGLESDSEFA